MRYDDARNSAVTPLSTGSETDRSDTPEPPARAEPEADQAPGGIPQDGERGAVQSVPKDLPDPAKARRLANLLPGGNASVLAARARKAAREEEREAREAGRLERLKTREGVLDELRRKVLADTGDSAFVASCKALLEQYAVTEQPQPARRVPRSVVEWLDNLEMFEGPVEVVERDGTITKTEPGANGGSSVKG